MPVVIVGLEDSQAVYTCLVMLKETAVDCDELVLTCDLQPLDSMSEDQHSYHNPCLY